MPGEGRESRLAGLLRERVLGAGAAEAAAAGFVVRRAHGWSAERATVGCAPDGAIFDLASVSKPLTALLVARLVEAEALRWTTTLGELLPELRRMPSGGASVEALLSHRAGLLPHRELFRGLYAGLPVDRRLALAEAASARRAGDPTLPVYSDLGYLLVGEGVARRLGSPLDALIEQHVTGPLGLSIASARRWRAHELGFERRVVRTELVLERGGEVRGAVHDDNAWALAGYGCAGHAGLFGTLDGVLGLGAALLDCARGRGPLASAAAPLLLRRPGGTLRLGLDGTSGAGSAAGSLAGADCFGHLGFTGTSLWCDPARDAAGALLTNRVYPSRARLGIRAARPLVQDDLWRAADALCRAPGPDPTANRAVFSCEWTADHPIG